MFISEYQFYLDTEPKALKLDENTPPKQLKKLYFRDSIFQFFPYAEITIQDSDSSILNNIFFVEGMKFNLKLGRPENKDANSGKVTGGYIEHQFCWYKNLIDNCSIGNNVSGDNTQNLVSSLYLKNNAQTKAFKKPISSIVNDVLNQQFQIPTTSIKKISNTLNNGEDIWYQAGRKPSEFLKYLASRSYSSANPQNSNFTTFFNLGSEFYFQSFYDLYNQAPIKTFKIKTEQQTSLSDDAIRQLEITNIGMEYTYNNYNRKINKLKSDGSFVSQEKKISEYNLKLGANYKPIIDKKQINETKRYENLGVERTIIDKETFLSKEFEETLNMNNLYQMKVEVRFDRNLISGRKIKIDNEQDKNLPLNFISGEWLIIKSEHFYLIDGSAFSVLYIAKPSILVGNKYFFAKEVV